MKELELVFFVDPDGVEVLVEVDRRARGFTGFLESALEMNERKQRLSFSAAELGRGRQLIAERLASLIERLSG